MSAPKLRTVSADAETFLRLNANAAAHGETSVTDDAFAALDPSVDVVAGLEIGRLPADENRPVRVETCWALPMGGELVAGFVFVEADDFARLPDAVIGSDLQSRLREAGSYYYSAGIIEEARYDEGEPD